MVKDKDYQDFYTWVMESSIKGHIDLNTAGGLQNLKHELDNALTFVKDYQTFVESHHEIFDKFTNKSKDKSEQSDNWKSPIITGTSAIVPDVDVILGQVSKTEKANGKIDLAKKPKSSDETLPVFYQIVFHPNLTAPYDFPDVKQAFIETVQKCLTKVIPNLSQQNLLRIILSPRPTILFQSDYKNQDEIVKVYHTMKKMKLPVKLQTSCDISNDI